MTAFTGPVLTDADVPGVWRALGLDGLLDVHVHFLPEPVLRKVWAYFAEVSYAGRPWPVHYPWPEPERLERLRQMGVRRFSALCYPHKPAMAAWLNDWSAGFAAATPDAWSSFTFYPEPGAAAYVAEALGRGAQVGKAHVEVGAYDPRDPLLDEVWGICADAAVPVVVHCGDGPRPGAYTGVGPIGEVLARHPTLTLVVAHLGMPRYADFLDLAERYERVHLDTTMAFTDYVEQVAPYPVADRGRLRDLGDRILLGSDFPNVPYPYAHQLEALVRLELGDDWLRGVLWDNAARLLPV